MLCSFLFPPTLLQAAWRMDYELANVAAAAKPATQPAVTLSPERTPAVPGDFVLDQRDRAGDSDTLSWAGGAEPGTLSLAGGGGVTDPSPLTLLPPFHCSRPLTGAWAVGTISLG